MTVKKIVVDSSVIAEHLTTKKSTSILRRISQEYFCYTTVFNAIELFAAAGSQKETQAVQDAMDALKVLGINPKSAKNIASVVSSNTMDYTTLIAAICIESKLPIVTLNPKRFSRIKHITIVSANDLKL
ncbi:MAG: type II toxin-antitoxin system VapC family toxin [Bacteroidota bacterium]